MRRGSEEFSPSRPPQVHGLGSVPGCTAGGAEAWSLAEVWALVAPCGARGSAEPGLLPALGQAGHPASNLPDTRHSAAPLDSDAGRVPSPRTEPGSVATKGQLFMGRLGVLPRPALSSASPEEWRQHGGKSSQSKVGHISYFPK